MEDDFLEIAARNRKRAEEVIADTGLADSWRSVGAEPRLVGSLAMGLLMKHRDIDFHIYSSPLKLSDSFKAMSMIAANPSIVRIEYRNMTDTDEKCVEWHAWYEDKERETWQIDMIHILKGSRYDGYFERMASRIRDLLTEEIRRTILKLKYLTPETEHIMGVEYYQAVLEGGVRDMREFRLWREKHPVSGIVEWMP